MQMFFSDMRPGWNPPFWKASYLPDRYEQLHQQHRCHLQGGAPSGSVLLTFVPPGFGAQLRGATCLHCQKGIVEGHPRLHVEPQHIWFCPHPLPPLSDIWCCGLPPQEPLLHIFDIHTLHQHVLQHNDNNGHLCPPLPGRKVPPAGQVMEEEEGGSFWSVSGHLGNFVDSLHPV